MKTATKPINVFSGEAVPPRAGQTVEGTIIKTDRSTVYIDLGQIGTGIIYGKEYLLARYILGRLKIGEKIKAKIVEVDNANDYVELSLKEAQRETSWQKLKRIEQEGQAIVIKISGANKGGLLAEVESIKGFLPLSQLSVEHYPRVENGQTSEILKSLQKIIGKDLKVKIIDVSQEENKLIFSEKAVTSKAISRLLEQYKPGDVVEGKITGLADFGAFIKFSLPDNSKAAVKNPESAEELPQTEGLIHISELDWQLIDDVSEVVKAGDKIKAKIIDISKDGRVSLSLKALKEDPWKGIDKKYKKGDVVKGGVVKINSLGAFIEVAPKIRGLLHLSEFGNQANIKDVLSKNKDCQFEIISLDSQTHKMGLRLLSEKKQAATE